MTWSCPFCQVKVAEKNAADILLHLRQEGLVKYDEMAGVYRCFCGFSGDRNEMRDHVVGLRYEAHVGAAAIMRSAHPDRVGWNTEGLAAVADLRNAAS